MKVLFLTHRLPYAPNRGDRIRAFHMIRQMARFAEVSLFSLVHDEEEAAEASSTPNVARVAIARVSRRPNLVRGLLSLPSSVPLTHTLLHAPDASRQLEGLVATAPPDVVLAFCSGMAKLALEPPLNRYPFVLDMVDVDSVKWRDMAARTSWPLAAVYRREARTLGAFEATAARRARATLVVNEREADALRSGVAGLDVTVVENGIDLEGFRPAGPPAATPTVVFCGVLNYAPNEEGVLWFARDVWPLVRRAEPDARFVVVGAGVTKRIASLPQSDPSITVTGPVVSVQAHLWQAAVSVAPLKIARGLQNKVLEALAAGLPTVVTPAVAGGLPPSVSPGCRTADTAEAFAREVTGLLGLTASERRAMAARAELEPLTWTSRLSPLETLLRRAADTPR